MKPYGALRTRGAGTLRSEDDGTEVILGGWVDARRDHGGVAFLDLRDRSGIVQVVADPDAGEALAAAHQVRNEYVIRVRGRVRRRPEGMENPDLATGDVEVAASSLEVLNRAETPPFPIEDRISADEALRLTYRYLDLRRPAAGDPIVLRAQVTSVIRRVMASHGFLDIETPMLTRSTPEGARDFLVPSRLQPGSVYALPQSPQLFKQLLMVAGMERYYQIVRCFRDEDLRADRQPEFTQLDIEASFIDEEDLYSLLEELMGTLWREVLGVELPTPFPRLTHAEALRRFGSDKPDTRFGMELVDCGDVLATTEAAVFASALQVGGSVVAIALPDGGDLTRKQFDDWVAFARARGAKGLAWAVVEQDGSLRSPLAKFLRDDEVKGLIEVAGATPGDALFLSAGSDREARELLGAVRVALAAERGMIPEGRWDFVWVTRWPLFAWDPERQRWDSEHHPFTAPEVDWVERLEQDPGAVIARAYDLVLNGTELGGGSIRIADLDLQRRVFALLGISEAEASERFGFFLRGLSYGAPPHGGIAFGLDRIVMLMAGKDSIRDVIPFPKTQSGADPLTGAPAPVDPAQLAELGLRRLAPPRSS
jgi:aspartyl-tRNA synthetase